MKTILIVDDDQEYKDGLTVLLEDNNYKVITASDGLHGFRKAKSENPDLIILDVMMSRITEGFETLKKFKKDRDTKDIPVILSTGVKDYHKNISLKPDKDWLPVSRVLEKPVDPQELLTVLEELLENS